MKWNEEPERIVVCGTYVYNVLNIGNGMCIIGVLKGDSITVSTGSEQVLNGYYPHHAPFGYKHDKKTWVLTPNENAGTVRQIYNLKEQNHSTHDITLMVGRKEALIKRVLNDQVYKGMIKWKGDIFCGNHEPILEGYTRHSKEDISNNRIEKKETDKGRVRLLEYAKKKEPMIKNILSEIQKDDWVYCMKIDHTIPECHVHTCEYYPCHQTL